MGSTVLGGIFLGAKAIANMKNFFKSNDFAKNLASNSQKTTKIYQGQSIFKMTKKLGEIRKGDQYYLDGREKNHLEVFDAQGKSRGVYNLDGTKNLTKTEAAKGRTID